MKENIQQFEKILSQRVVVDTNILVYCGNKDFGYQAKTLLRTLKNGSNDLGVSHASCFELIKNARDEKIRDYYFSLIEYIHNIPITQEIIKNSYVLYHTYLDRNVQDAKKIESFDLIISGTMIYHKGALLLTANRRDFPMPFWNNKAQGYFMYKDGESCKLINLFLLEFDYAQLKMKQEKI